jgi:hypothetical protein
MVNSLERTPEKTLISLINLFNTYKTTIQGVTISGDDCRMLESELKELVKKYNIENI